MTVNAPRDLRALLQVRLPRKWLAVGGLVVAAVGIDFVLGLPFGTPRIFGDELIYWEMGRSFAWTGHFSVRGAANPGYGVGYPALLSVLQRLTSTQAQAYAVARLVDSSAFSLAAVPVYCLASRVLPRRSAIGAAAGFRLRTIATPEDPCPEVLKDPRPVSDDWRVFRPSSHYAGWATAGRAAMLFGALIKQWDEPRLA